MTTLGQLALWIALIISAWGTFVGFYGGMTRRQELIESARRSTYALAGVIIVGLLGVRRIDVGARVLAVLLSAEVAILLLGTHRKKL